MESILSFVLQAALVIHILLLGVSIWRVWRGENVIDRLIASDLATTLALGVLVIVALIRGSSLYLDVALALALMGFVGTLALTRYIVDQSMF